MVEIMDKNKMMISIGILGLAITSASKNFSHRTFYKNTESILCYILIYLISTIISIYFAKFLAIFFKNKDGKDKL